jgi:hypothetical protein
MKTELIREYASEMARIFAAQVSKVKREGQTGDYLRSLEGRRDFWAKIAELPSDSKHWESITSYTKLMSDRKASKTRIRALYKSLEELLG